MIPASSFSEVVPWVWEHLKVLQTGSEEQLLNQVQLYLTS